MKKWMSMTLMALLLLAATACDDGNDGCDEGTLNCECYHGSCEEGLVCVYGEPVDLCSQPIPDDTEMVTCSGGMADPSTGLCWQEPPSDEEVYVQEGFDYCDTLETGGFDTWRTPTIDELRSLIRYCPTTIIGGACSIDESSPLEALGQIPECRGCGHSYENSPFWDDNISGNCEEGNYLSSSLIEGEWDGEVWMIDFRNASYTYNNNYESLPRNACIRCVRDYSGT